MDDPFQSIMSFVFKGNTEVDLEKVTVRLERHLDISPMNDIPFYEVKGIIFLTLHFSL